MEQWLQITSFEHNDFFQKPNRKMNITVSHT